VKDVDYRGISNVNVFLKKSRMGIASDSTGLLAFPEYFFGNLNDTIMISAIGYQSLTYEVNDFLSVYGDSRLLILKSNTVVLDEIEVVGDRNGLMLKEFGYYGSKPSVFKFSASPGKHICVKIENKDGIPGYLKSVYIRTERNLAGKFKTQLKLRFYRRVNDNFVVCDVLNGEEIIILNYRRNKLSVDISKFNIPFNEHGLYIGLEILSPSNVVYKTNDDFDVAFKTTAANSTQNTWIFNQNEWVLLNSLFNEKELKTLPKSFQENLNKSNIMIGITVAIRNKTGTR
jgi:hypothetical protein